MSLVTGWLLSMKADDETLGPAPKDKPSVAVLLSWDILRDPITVRIDDGAEISAGRGTSVP